MNIHRKVLNIHYLLAFVHSSQSVKYQIFTIAVLKLYFMNSRALLQFMFFCVFTFPVFSQNSTERTKIGYIRIQLNDIETWEEASTIDAFIRSKPDVLVTRTDNYSDTFYAQYTFGTLTESDFVAWIQSLGFNAKCIVTGLSNGEPLKEFPRGCSEVNQQLQERTH